MKVRLAMWGHSPAERGPHPLTGDRLREEQKGQS